MFFFPMDGHYVGSVDPLGPVAELTWKVSNREKEQTQANFLCHIVAQVSTQPL